MLASCSRSSTSMGANRFKIEPTRSNPSPLGVLRCFEGCEDGILSIPREGFTSMRDPRDQGEDVECTACGGSGVERCTYCPEPAIHLSRKNLPVCTVCLIEEASPSVANPKTHATEDAQTAECDAGRSRRAVLAGTSCETMQPSGVDVPHDSEKSALDVFRFHEERGHDDAFICGFWAITPSTLRGWRRNGAPAYAKADVAGMRHHDEGRMYGPSRARLSEPDALQRCTSCGTPSDVLRGHSVRNTEAGRVEYIGPNELLCRTCARERGATSLREINDQRAEVPRG